MRFAAPNEEKIASIAITSTDQVSTICGSSIGETGGVPLERPGAARSTTTASERGKALEKTSERAREAIAEERRRREDKSERLRQARLQAEQQQRQL